MRSPLFFYDENIYNRPDAVDRGGAFDPDRCQVAVDTKIGRMYKSTQCANKPKGERPVRMRDDTEVVLPVCGRHIAQYDRRVAEQKDEASARSDAAREMSKAHEAAKRISDRLGVRVAVEMTTSQKFYISRPTGYVRIAIADLLEHEEE